MEDCGGRPAWNVEEMRLNQRSGGSGSGGALDLDGSSAERRYRPWKRVIGAVVRSGMTMRQTSGWWTTEYPQFHSLLLCCGQLFPEPVVVDRQSDKCCHTDGPHAAYVLCYSNTGSHGVKTLLTCWKPGFEIALRSLAWLLHIRAATSPRGPRYAPSLRNERHWLHRGLSNLSSQS